jgi:hypothetical protein
LNFIPVVTAWSLGFTTTNAFTATLRYTATAEIIAVPHAAATSSGERNSPAFFRACGPRQWTGTATAGGASTITDSSKAWVVNSLAGRQLRILRGTSAGDTRTISSNTASRRLSPRLRTRLRSSSSTPTGSWSSLRLHRPRWS